MTRSQAARWTVLAFAVPLSLFTLLFVRNAWVVDDAYITFRTVDNLLSGHGLVWNLGERVQAYSHPLWMLLVSGAAWATGEVFYTSIALSYGLLMASFWLIWRKASRDGESWRGPVFVLCVLASKCVMDFSSSGLENPASDLLATLFLCVFFAPRSGAEDPARRVAMLFFVSSLAALNRMDTGLLYAPALVACLWEAPAGSRLRLLRVAAIATAPIALWVLFATVYYGTPFPNTAYAKTFGLGVPVGEKFVRGIEYLGNSLQWDLGSQAVPLLALALALRRRSRPALLMLAGVAVYYGHILLSAAAATHMSGRFFALPVWISLVIAVWLLPSVRAGAGLAACAVLALLVNPHSPLRMGTSWYAEVPQDPDHIDTNWFVHNEGAALQGYFEGRPLPDHDWYHAGLAFREKPDLVTVGAEGGAAIGYFAYAAGPGKLIVDYCGLADPLLARLPACNARPPGAWRSGHFFRSLPDGYLASLASGENRIEDPALHVYYDKLRLITRGPLFRVDRFAAIAAMNLGLYDGLVREYARAAPAGCRIPTRRPLR